jgi:uncharacterized membrane-anchored protein YhcB (DUF1043 family)
MGRIVLFALIIGVVIGIVMARSRRKDRDD